MLAAVTAGAVAGPVVSWLGISAAEFACFMIFWAIQVFAANCNYVHAPMKAMVASSQVWGRYASKLHPCSVTEEHTCLGTV